MKKLENIQKFFNGNDLFIYFFSFVFCLICIDTFSDVDDDDMVDDQHQN